MHVAIVSMNSCVSIMSSLINSISFEFYIIYGSYIAFPHFCEYITEPWEEEFDKDNHLVANFQKPLSLTFVFSKCESLS